MDYSPPASPTPVRPQRTHPPTHHRSACTTTALLPLPPATLPTAGPAPGGLSKPFHLADVARAALARPRPLAPWSPSPSSSQAEWGARDGSTSPRPDSDGDSSSSGSSFGSPSSSPASSNTSTPFSSPPSSCALTPTSSSEGWAHASTSQLPPTPRTPEHLRAARLERPVAAHAPASPLPATPQWTAEGFSLKLLFTSAQSPTVVPEDDDHSLPPAFFPSARISFSPRLRVVAPEGLPYSALGGMHLGVTGMCETLDQDGNVKSKRMIADFCTDLSSGINIWKRDGLAARRAAQLNGDDDDLDCDTLPQGTYVLPLTMKIPNSERL